MPKFEREVEIDAPVEKVWEVLINPTHWPQWFPVIDSINQVASIHEGGSFEFVDEGQTGRGTIVKMVPLKHLEILTRIGDDEDSHVFELRESGGFFGMSEDECKVEYKLDTLMGGGILGKFVAGGNPKDVLRVKNTKNKLRKLVESL